MTFTFIWYFGLAASELSRQSVESASAHGLSSLARNTFHWTMFAHAWLAIPSLPVVRATSGVLVGTPAIAKRGSQRRRSAQVPPFRQYLWSSGRPERPSLQTGATQALGSTAMQPTFASVSQA